MHHSYTEAMKWFIDELDTEVKNPFLKIELQRSKVHPTHALMDTRGFYFDDLQPYLKLFSKDQIFFIDGDSIVKNPTAEFGLIEDFLDVNRELKFSYNEIRGFHCLEEPTEMCLGGNKGRTRYSSYIM